MAKAWNGGSVEKALELAREPVEHTRGWRSQGWVPTWAYIPVHDASHNLICSLYPSERHGYTRDEVAANARLIVAAPRLKSALMQLLSIAGTPVTPRQEAIFAEVRAVLNEVKGDKP